MGTRLREEAGSSPKGNFEDLNITRTPGAEKKEQMEKTLQKKTCIKSGKSRD